MAETTDMRGLGIRHTWDSFEHLFRDRAFSRFLARSASRPEESAEASGKLENEPVAVASASVSLPTDPSFSLQWHLDNDQAGELDLNVTGVWPSYTGEGVTAFVIDDGFDYTHPDLAPNYDTSLDFDFEGNDDDPFGTLVDDAHGTATMGILGAARNATDVVGVAYDATLVGYRIHSLIGNSFISQIGDAIEQAADDGADLVSMSLGSQFSGNFFDQGISATLIADLNAAIDSAVDTGRDGLGAILVKSAGNGRDNFPLHNANASSWNADFKTISVGATNADGTVTSYSTPGANLLISAFGSPIPGTVVTTDRVGAAGYGGDDITTTFNGTSAAAPMVSGVVALMLEANPDLGWRDVQDILAYSARQTTSGGNWVENGTDTWNANGLTHSVDYGFGLVDALAAVRLAETWQTQKTSADLTAKSVNATGLPQAVPDNDPNGVTVTFSQDATIGRVEFATLTLNLPHTWAGDLLITLTSPAGTTTTLLSDNATDSADHPASWTYTAAAFRGEAGAGTWTLKVVDQVGSDVGTLTQATLTLHGDPPDDDDLYVFTEAFSEVAALTGSSTSIEDSDNGRDLLNAAAVGSASNLDLTTGNGVLDGVAITISGIEDVASGDGGDDINGDGADNRFWGGRGDDELEGQGGKDSLYGGSGADDLGGQRGDDILSGGSGADVSFQGHSGKDTITGDEGDDAKLFGGSRSDIIDGGDGEDQSIFGGVGNDTLSGGSGNDGYFYGQAGLDTLSGNTGADSYLDGGLNADVIYGGVGDDTALLGERGNDLIYGGAGDDRTLDGDRGGDKIYGGSGLDAFVFGDLSPDLLAGEEGDDFSFYGGAGNDSIFGGSGNDSYFHGNGKRDTVYGGSGNDTFFYGGGGIDRLYGAEGDDARFFGRAANDKIYGGSGDDSRLFGGNDKDSLFGGSGSDHLYGDDGADSLTGGAGGDSAFGGSGADIFLVASQGDFAGYHYDGGSGSDTLVLSGGATLPGGGANLTSVEVTLYA